MDDEIFLPTALSDALSESTADSESFEKQTEALTDEVPKPPAVSFHDRLGQLKTFLGQCGLPDMLLLRVVAMYLFVFAYQIHVLRKYEHILPIANWKDFVGRTSLAPILVPIVLGIVSLTLVHYVLPKSRRLMDPLAAVVAVICFDVSLLWKQGDVYLSMGVMLVSLIIIGYALGRVRSSRLFDRLHWSVCGVFVAALAVLSTAFIVILTIYRHKTFGSMVHDFGLFAQMFHSLADNLTAVTTMERDVPMSHFAVHASYIYYALVPVFKLFPYEETLLVAQGILAMGGIVPLFLIAKRRNFKGLSLVFIGAMYVFCAALISPCFYDFHENAFLPTLLMWTLWATDRKRPVLFYIFSILTCIVKEDAPLYIICIGLFWFFEHKGSRKRLHGLIAAVVAGAYMIGITSWLTKHGDGTMMTSTRFGHLLLDPEGGLVQVVINSVSNPGYFFSLLIQEDTIVFFIRMMLPLLFMPLFTKKIHRFLLLLPFVITNLVVGVNYGYAVNIEFQYVFGPATLLLFLAVCNTADLSRRTRQDMAVLLGCAAFIMSMGTLSHHLNKIADYQNNAGYFQALEETLDAIPEDAVIGGNAFLIPHLSDREEVYLYDMGDIDQEAGCLKEPYKYDFIVLGKNEKVCLTADPLLTEAGYVKLETAVSNRYTIFVSPQYEYK